MVFAFISAWLAYKRAKAAGRNAIGWALIAAAVFIGTQVAVELGVGIFLLLGVGIFGLSTGVFEAYTIPVTVFAIIASFGTTWLVLRHLDKIPENKVYSPPPAPPNFKGDI